MTSWYLIHRFFVLVGPSDLSLHPLENHPGFATAPPRLSDSNAVLGNLRLLRPRRPLRARAGLPLWPRPSVPKLRQVQSGGTKCQLWGKIPGGAEAIWTLDQLLGGDWWRLVVGNGGSTHWWLVNVWQASNLIGSPYNLTPVHVFPACLSLRLKTGDDVHILSIDSLVRWSHWPPHDLWWLMHMVVFETRYGKPQHLRWINLNYMVNSSKHIWFYMYICSCLVCFVKILQGGFKGSTWFNSTQVGSTSCVFSGRPPVEFYLDKLSLCCWHRHQRIFRGDGERSSCVQPCWWIISIVIYGIFNHNCGNHIY